MAEFQQRMTGSESIFMFTAAGFQSAAVINSSPVDRVPTSWLSLFWLLFPPIVTRGYILRLILIFMEKNFFFIPSILCVCLTFPVVVFFLQ